jgi:hypothetical protein
VHDFLGGFTLVTAGNQTLAATDKADITLIGGATIIVVPGPSSPPGGGAQKPEMAADKLENPPAKNSLPSLDVAFVDRIFAFLRVEEPLFLLPRFTYKLAGENLLSIAGSLFA